MRLKSSKSWTNMWVTIGDTHFYQIQFAFKLHYPVMESQGWLLLMILFESVTRGGAITWWHSWESTEISVCETALRIRDARLWNSVESRLKAYTYILCTVKTSAQEIRHNQTKLLFTNTLCLIEGSLEPFRGDQWFIISWLTRGGRSASLLREHKHLYLMMRDLRSPQLLTLSVTSKTSSGMPDVSSIKNNILHMIHSIRHLNIKTHLRCIADMRKFLLLLPAKVCPTCPSLPPFLVPLTKLNSFFVN